MPQKPRQPAPIESDLLAWIEGEPLAPRARAGLDRLFESDPALRAFAENARSDRERLRLLAGLDESRAPRGMVQAAFEQAERDSLLGLAVPAESPGPRRLRITPIRLAAGIAAVIVVGAGSLIGLIVNTPTHPSAPIASRPDPQADRLESLATTQPGHTGGPSAPTPTSRPLAAVAEPAAVESGSARAGAARSALDEAPLSPLSVRLIRSAQAGPAGAVSPDRAAGLALQGRLIVVARSASPAAVERAILAATPDGRELVRWRSIESLAGGISTDTLPETAPRVLLADVLATPAALEHVVAVLTAADAPTLGAWLQEVEEGLRMTPEQTVSDRAWWTRPADTWAPRVTVPVLIEFARDND